VAVSHLEHVRKHLGHLCLMALVPGDKIDWVIDKSGVNTLLEESEAIIDPEKLRGIRPARNVVFGERVKVMTSDPLVLDTGVVDDPFETFHNVVA
jgi:hypothetical protein